MNISLIYHKYYTPDGVSITIGGIQTYLSNLCDVLVSNGHNVTLYQCSSSYWNKNIGTYSVVGVPVCDSMSPSRKSKIIVSRVMSESIKTDLMIWGTDNISVKVPNVKTLAIQHGIGFDGVWSGRSLLKFKSAQIVYKFLQRWKSVKSFLNSECKVCVDYNYLNWVRTMLPRSLLDEVYVIPNFTNCYHGDFIERNSKTGFRVLYARRFTEERGALLMIQIAERLLSMYDDIHFTFAGNGPYRNVIVEHFADHPRVLITEYAAEESLEIHSKHHLAIIPTCWSEGTSLSLLEAMTSGCVPIASNIGGMTNIVLDGYNGRLVNPNAEEFIRVISELHDDEELRLKIQQNAKSSADQAFSLDVWKQKWLNLIHKL